jgi:uncharacterized protein (TIRG00374 family)
VDEARVRKRSAVGRALRAGRYVITLILLGLAVNLILPQIATLDRSMQVLKSMALWAVGLAAGMQFLSYVGSGFLLRSICSVAGQRLSLARGVLITVAGSSIGLIAGGMLGSVAAVYNWARKSGVSSEGALLGGWLPPLFNEGTLTIIAIVGLVQLLATHELSTLQAAGFAVSLSILGGAVAVILWGVYHRARLSDIALRLSRLGDRMMHREHNPVRTENAVGRLFEAWDVMRRGGWRGPEVGAALNIGFDLLTLYFLFVAAGHPVGPGVLLAGYGLPLMVGRISFLPGGVGIVEGTMTALYDSFGVPNGVTVVVVLTYRVMSFWLPTILGFPLAIYLQRAWRK